MDTFKKTDKPTGSSEMGQPNDTEIPVKSMYDPPLTFKVVSYEIGM